VEDNGQEIPDYPLDEVRVLNEPAQVRALAHPLRTTILGLLHERAASVTELSSAVDRPKSTVAHHVKVLLDAGLLRVVRTRRVRAVEEAFYGRTARMFYTGAGRRDMPLDFNDFEVAAQESAAAYQAGELWAFIRHARLAPERRKEFWLRIKDLVAEFDHLPRDGETTYGFVAGIYPVEPYPRLPADPE